MPPSPRPDAEWRSGLRLAGLIVGGVGLGLGLAGYAVWRYVPGIVAAEHARLEALPTPDAISLTDMPAGREILVEGRIAPEQPVRFRDFVAYVKEEERRDTRDDGSDWREVERITPPLTLVVGEGRVEIVNASYGLLFADTRWHDTSKIIDTAYYGLVAREAVVVRGRATAGGGIEATTVGSGSRAAYLSRVAGNAAVAWWLGVGFGGVGVILLIVAIVLFVAAVRKARALRRPVPWPPEPGPAR